MNGPNPSDPATRTAGDLPSTAGPDRTGTYDSDRTPPANSATPPLEPPADGAGRPTAEANGRYQVVGPHKRGGLGQVWLAWDTLAERTVALKTIRPDRTGSDNLVKRFAREARVTGQLEHPGIVPVYDLGERDGEPHYVMRFVRGRTLSEAAQEFHGSLKPGPAGRPALRDLLDRFLGVCHAIAFAHDRGYLHRDLKGSNIILGDFHEVFVLDWGLVKKIGEPDRPGDPTPLSPALDEPQTRTGAVLGTPEYMAPEVAGKQPATTASDVYGLGAVLYHILTGHPPIEGTTPEEMLSKLTQGAPIPPPRTFNPTAPPALEAIARKALARTPADRYPSATALADEVRRWLADEPVTAYPEPWPTRAARWARRHRTGVTAAAVALVLTAAGSAVAAGLIWKQQQETRRERDRAEVMLAVLLEYSNNLAGVVTAVETGQASTPQSVAARIAWVRHAADATGHLLDALPDDPAQQTQIVKLLRYTATLARLTNDQAAAERALGAAGVIQQRLVERYPTDHALKLRLAHIREDQAELDFEFGRPDRALAGTQSVAELLPDEAAGDRVGPEFRRLIGMTRILQAVALTHLDRPDDARTAARDAAGIFSRLSALKTGGHTHDPVYHSQALLALAQSWREVARARGGDMAPARAAEDSAVDVLRTAARPDAHPDVWHNYYRALVERARLRLDAGDVVRAADGDLDRAVSGWRELIARDPGVANWRFNLAVGLTVRGRSRIVRPADAAADFAEAVRMLNRLTTDCPGRPGYHAALATAWAGQARCCSPGPERQAAYQQAVSTVEAAVARGQADVLLARLRDQLFAEAARSRTGP